MGRLKNAGVGWFRREWANGKAEGVLRPGSVVLTVPQDTAPTCLQLGFDKGLEVGADLVETGADAKGGSGLDIAH